MLIPTVVVRSTMEYLYTISILLATITINMVLDMELLVTGNMLDMELLVTGNMLDTDIMHILEMATDTMGKEKSTLNMFQ